MRKSKSLGIISILMLSLVIITSVPFSKAEAKAYTQADVIKMFSGCTELDEEKVLNVIAGMDLNAKQRNFFKVIIPLAIQDMIDNDILASLTIAQSVWEGGWGVGNIALVANNIFGIMAASNWDGKVYCTTTKQVYGSYSEAVKKGGNRFFRAYDSWADSVHDHSELFLSSDRYQVFIGLKDYKAACKYVYSTGYATSKNYPNELIGTIESHNLTLFDTIANEIIKAKKIAASIMPTSVSISASKIVLGLGSSYELDAKVQPSNANSDITWTSNGSGINVSEGVVSADKVGSANIMAETVNGMGVECSVTVIDNFDFIVIGSSVAKYTGNGKIAAVPTFVSTLSGNSFSGKKNLSEVIIPSTVKSIDSTAFKGCGHLTVCGYTGSYAEEFARKNNMSFKSITNILFDSSNNFATDVSCQSSVQEILTSIGGNGEIKDKYGVDVPSNSENFVGTGSVVTVDGKEYQIAVKGDVSGDGIISQMDLESILRCFKGLKYFDGAELLAADADGDGRITPTDYLLIKNALMRGSREL